eukprot:jgi/Astpho2/2033/Aster-x0499
MQEATEQGQTVQLELFDVAGLGAGGSGAAGGLLHPYTPKGKELWRGHEAFGEALELLKVAEQCAGDQQVAWRQDIMRPALDRKQAAGFDRISSQMQQEPDGITAAGISANSARERHPTMAAQVLHQARQQKRIGIVRPESPPVAGQAPDAPLPQAAALLIRGGAVLHPERYVKAVWRACERLVQQHPASQATLRLQHVTSLAALEAHHGPFDAVIVAAGAAAATIAEIEAAALPLELVQGYLIDMAMPPAGAAALQDSAFAGGGPAAATSLSDDSQQGAEAGPQIDSDLPAAPVAGCTAEADGAQVVPPDQGAILESDRHGPDGRDASGAATEGRLEAGVPAEAWPEGAPSLLGPTYLAARGCREVVVGATKRYGLTPQQALQECRRVVEDWTSRNAAKRGLLPKAAQLWEPLRGWQVQKVRSGVRALPPRLSEGAIPLAGRLDGHVWLILGLGARGLVYHAWLGKLLSQAILAGDDALLPEELLRWKARTKA